MDVGSLNKLKRSGQELTFDQRLSYDKGTSGESTFDLKEEWRHTALNSHPYNSTNQDDTEG